MTQKIVALGDSITEAYALPPTVGWTHLLAQDLQIEVINSGISGDTTGGMLARFNRDVLAHQPTHLIIMGGTNDLSFQLSNKLIFSNIYSIIQQAKHHQIIPIIGVPPPFFPPKRAELESTIFSNDADYSKRIATFQKALKTFAQEIEKPFIDFSEDMTADLFLPDGIHPNEQGHAHMKELAKRNMAF